MHYNVFWREVLQIPTIGISIFIKNILVPFIQNAEISCIGGLTGIFMLILNRWERDRPEYIKITEK